MHGGSLAKIPKRFPSIPHMKRMARWHIPGFAWEYMIGGIGVDRWDGGHAQPSSVARATVSHVNMALLTWP